MSIVEGEVTMLSDQEFKRLQDGAILKRELIVIIDKDAHASSSAEHYGEWKPSWFDEETDE